VNGEPGMEERITFGLGRVEGCYSNYLKVGQNAFEFLLDFGQMYIDDGEPQFHARIITTPVYAKAFLKVLQDCIDHYERNFGTIVEEPLEIQPLEKWWNA
jgi:hypothetical protein